ncbi:MAG: phosphoribosylformylglycinamidine synthase subunit PurS [Abditibacteriaceae bacterium]
MPKAFITVTLKDGLFDAQGAAVQKGLLQLGHQFVQGVSIGKFITVEMDESYSTADLESRVDQMCQQLLANPVIEEYEVRLENGAVSSGVPIQPAAPVVPVTVQSIFDTPVREPFSFDYTVYCDLPRDEQLALRSQALLKHGAWITTQLDERDADWILVVGGEVVDSGASFDSYPNENRLKELGTANNLVPWAFTRPSR